MPIFDINIKADDSIHPNLLHKLSLIAILLTFSSLFYHTNLTYFLPFLLYTKYILFIFSGFKFLAKEFQYLLKDNFLSPSKNLITFSILSFYSIQNDSFDFRVFIPILIYSVFCYKFPKRYYFNIELLLIVLPLSIYLISINLILVTILFFLIKKGYRIKA